MRGVSTLAACALTILASGAASAQTAPAAPRFEAPAVSANPYRAYEFLIGDWYTRPNGAQGPSIHQRFEWGPNRSYIRYATLMAEPGKPEAVHFEGMLVWRGATETLDFLIVVEPGSGDQEQGTVHVEADGSIIRDVLLTRADGQTSRFRQTFRSTGRDTAVTTLMRQTTTGWVPTFPGSDNLQMSRAPG